MDGNLVNQSNLFKQGEGDAWYIRNRDSLANLNLDLEMEPITRILLPFKDLLNSVLEIGCSDGRRLEYLCGKLGARGSGIDPSKMAIEAGNLRLAAQPDSQITLQIGGAQELAFKDEKFDLVFFGFSLYLLDRNQLQDAVIEANRVLRKGGFLVILDFDVTQPYSVPYRHMDGIQSYKDCYEKYFIALGNYHLAHKFSFGHKSMYFQLEKSERIAYTILFKELLV